MKFSTLFPLILIAVFATGCFRAKEKNAGPAPVAPASASDSTPDSTQRDAAEANPWQTFDFFEVVDETFVLPETDDLKEIKQFANMINKSDPSGEDIDDWEHFFKLQRQYAKAVYDTGVKIHDHPDATEKDKTNALKMQAKGLVELVGDDTDTYLEKIRELAETLEENPDTEKAALSCWSAYYQNYLAEAAFEDDDEAYRAAIDEVLEFVERHKDDAAIRSAAGFLLEMLIFYSDESVAEANALRLQEILETSSQPAIKKFAATIPGTVEQSLAFRKQAAEQQQSQNAEMDEGLARREALPGNEMEFECLLLSGEKLNLKDWEGKVVLVDFWATWCRPCIAEIPDMTAAYEKYHDEGFEIIGYSTDRDLDALNDFVAERQPPWQIGSRLMSTEAGLTDYSEYYGVATIPTMILVGKDGKVVSIEARGNTLTRELEKIFEH